MIPRPLLALLGAVAVTVVAWALLVPPFMVPDEAEHFAFVQSLAENGERPPRGTPADLPLSTEQRYALLKARTTAATGDLRFKPAWEPSEEREWRAMREGLRRDDIVSVETQSERPPTYYALQVLPYLVSPSDDPFDRLFLMRLFSALLMLVTTAGAWLLIGELSGSNRLLQLGGSASVGLQPMTTFVSAGVHPDALLFASYSLALWLMARISRRGWSTKVVAGLLAATAAAVLTKEAGLALVPAVAFVVLNAARQHGSGLRTTISAATVASVAVAGAALALHDGLWDRATRDLRFDSLRGFGTYLWDFYLPRLPFQHEYSALHLDYPAWTVWVKHTWASFGFLEVQFPVGAYVALFAVAVVVMGSAAVALLRGRFAIGRTTFYAFALVAVCLVIAAHWNDFLSVNNDDARSFQGRYLLPLMPLVGVAVAAALSNMRRRAMGVALVLGGLAVLDLFSLAVTAGRYFA